MSRQANGNYLQPANTAAVSGATISSTAFNTLITDVGTELTNSLDRQGRSAMQANLPMGGFVITGAGTPVNPTDVPTKAYVDAAIWSTGDIKPTLKIVADTGWVFMNDGTIGSAGSGSSTRANADTQSLFNLLFANCADADCPILTSGGGATTRAAQTNAATAWAANCRMSLPKSLGRAMSVAGIGAGLINAHALGSSNGEEYHTLTLSEIPTGIISAQNSIGVSVVSSVNVPQTTSPTQAVQGGAGGVGWASTPGFGTITSTGSINVSTTSNNTSGLQHNNVAPSTWVNWMVKL